MCTGDPIPGASSSKVGDVDHGEDRVKKYKVKDRVDVDYTEKYVLYFGVDGATDHTNLAMSKQPSGIIKQGLMGMHHMDYSSSLV
jgi:hypothetical protein